jgi:LmbE family N-acetylglucosaminyl deacetylase
MELIVDQTHRGPSESAWADAVGRLSIPAMRPLHERRVVIIAPHPDDEVLGAAGLIQLALRERRPVEIIAVTDGEGSHPGSDAFAPTSLAALRIRESVEALRRLGWDAPLVTRLHIPDGKVSAHLRELDDALARIMLPDDLCVAPWIRDGHPDHDATGLAALQASQAVGAHSLGYLVWAWHWADPRGAEVPWAHCSRLDLGRRARARKRWSTAAFQSQTRPLGPSDVDAPILPDNVLRRFWRPYEIYVDQESVAS